MSLAVSGDNKKLVVGFVDAALMVRTRKADADGSLGVGVGTNAVKQQGRFYKGEKHFLQTTKVVTAARER